MTEIRVAERTDNNNGLQFRYLRYNGGDHVVLGGTAGNDTIISSIGDDTIWGDGGNDKLEGGFGNDNIDGGAGNDIITDSGGDDVIKGNDGNDVIQGGPGINLIIGGRGSDYIIANVDTNEVFAGNGNDFINGNTSNEGMLGNEGHDWIEVGTQDGAPGDNFDPFGRDNVTGHDVFHGDGGFDEFVGEGGNDIFVHSPGINRNEGMSGFDWITHMESGGLSADVNNAGQLNGVYADLELDAFDENPQVPFPFTAIDRYDAVEGISGGHYNDILLGSNTVELVTPGGGNGARGSVLNQAGINLIPGLQAVLGAGVTSFSTGDIMLGGDGSDTFEGRGGNDIIDGDRWLDVWILAPGGVVFRKMDGALNAAMLAGTYDPGDLQIVREILTSTGTSNIDTARYAGNRADYTITTVGGVVTVTDNDPVNPVTTGAARDEGTDTLRNIERIQFADQVVFTGQGAAIGAPAISDTTPTEGSALTANAGNITDPNGIASAITFQWQQSALGGGATFTNIAGATNATFNPGQAQVNRQLRVVASFVDGLGNPESRASEPTTVVGDLFNGNAAADVFTGTAAEDNASGNGGADTLNGLGGTDLLNGGAAADTLNGGEGNDTSIGGAGGDRLDGGARN